MTLFHKCIMCTHCSKCGRNNCPNVAPRKPFEVDGDKVVRKCYNCKHIMSSVKASIYNKDAMVKIALARNLGMKTPRQFFKVKHDVPTQYSERRELVAFAMSGEDAINFAEEYAVHVLEYCKGDIMEGLEKRKGPHLRSVNLSKAEVEVSRRIEKMKKIIKES